MAINKSLEHVSLTYCGIDAHAARGIFEVLIFTRSSLKELNLSGNALRNQGVIDIMRGLSINKSLTKIYLADN